MPLGFRMLTGRSQVTLLEMGRAVVACTVATMNTAVAHVVTCDVYWCGQLVGLVLMVVMQNDSLWK